MAFRLLTHQGNVDYGDEAAYSFNKVGLLVVTDGKGMQVTYSPAGWIAIEEAERDRPTTGAVFR